MLHKINEDVRQALEGRKEWWWRDGPKVITAVTIVEGAITFSGPYLPLCHQYGPSGERGEVGTCLPDTQ